MTVSLTRFSLQRRWFRDARAASGAATDRNARKVDTAWVLPGLVLALCIPTTGWLFSHGTAATAWLVVVVAAAVVGVPVALIVMRLFGYEDGD
jgi:hypothetical protein